MHILVTRPEEDAGELKEKLEARGHRVSLAPLIEIEFLPVPPESFDAGAVLVATSRNGLRALARSSAFDAARALPLFVVGQASARLAQDLLFRDVVAGPGRAAELAPVVLDYVKGCGRRVMLVTGEDTAFDMEAYLRSRDIPVQSVVAYRGRPAAVLPASVLDGVKQGDVDAVILMSARTAAAWMSLAAKSDLGPHLGQITHLCLSETIARAVQTCDLGQPFRPRIKTARRPEIEEILALAGGLAAQS